MERDLSRVSGEEEGDPFNHVITPSGEIVFRYFIPFWDLTVPDLNLSLASN